jgi:hypothetical protein
MTARILIAAISVWIASTALAGVTIHFEGTAKSAAEVQTVLKIAADFANQRNWKVEDASAPSGKLPRVVGGKEQTYEGRITGLVIYAHNMCEPIWLRFGDDLVFQDFVKTQFAGAIVHMEIIRLLDALKPALQSLTVRDEGEYWEKRDQALLENHFDQIKEALRQMKREEPAMYGPIKLNSGRIVDMIR